MKRSDFLIALSIFLASLALYIRTLAPGLLFGDSAEFQTIAYTLGMGHPTGYPIYILTAKIFTYLPIGEIAHRVNLLSAFFAAVTVAFIYLITRILDAKPFSGIFGSLLLALTPIFWKHATIAEIYAFSSACLAIILFALLNWGKSKTPRWLFFAGLFGGLSPGIHLTISLAALSVLLYLAINPDRNTANFTQKAKPAVLGVVSGLSIFLLSFYIVDQHNPAAGFYNAVALPSLSVWKMTSSDFDSPMERLAFLFFSPQFSGQFFSASLTKVIDRLGDFVRTYAGLLIFGSIGVLSTLIPFVKKTPHHRETWLLLSAFLTFMIFAVTYDVADFNVFYIPAILILAICASLGIERIVDINRQFKRFQRIAVICIYVICYMAGTPDLVKNLPPAWEDRISPGLEKKFLFGFQYPGAYKLNAEKIVNKIEDNAIVFTNWDRVYGLYYVSHVLNGRTEQDFHETYPQWDNHLPAESLLAYIDANIDYRPIYFTRYPDSLDDSYQVIQIDFGLFQITRK